jgi:SNF2 family DNA or RNA helicase
VVDDVEDEEEFKEKKTKVSREHRSQSVISLIRLLFLKQKSNASTSKQGAPSKKRRGMVHHTEPVADVVDIADHAPLTFETVTLEDELELPKKLYESLFPYQREGVQFLWRLYR